MARRVLIDTPYTENVLCYGRTSVTTPADIIDTIDTIADIYTLPWSETEHRSAAVFPFLANAPGQSFC